MSNSNINENSNDTGKLQNFLSEIKFPRNFKKKLTELYLTEFDEKFDQLLLKKDSEFMNIYLKRVRTILEDMYSNDCFENEDLAILMKTNEIEIYEKHYKPQYKLLNEALSIYSNRNSENYENNELNKNYDFLYDDDSMTIRDINLNEEKDINKILKEKICAEVSFRKHCRFIDDIPTHICMNGNSTNFIKLRSLKSYGNITYVICVECKMTYKSSCVLLYCNFCSLSYYSSINSSSIETPYLQPATWEKYHCSMIVNDQMRCIKCKDPLFFDLKENLLKCYNDRCLYETDPYSIFWTCVTCKKEFQTNAKIYNPLEYKLVRSAIKEALIFKKYASPNFLPCCQEQVNDEMIFYHKKECNGRIFFGTMQNRQIIVCEKCRSLSNYDRFIWTCPQCGKRFKNKSIEKNSTSNTNSITSSQTDNIQNKSNCGNNNLKFSSNNKIKLDIMVNSAKLGSTNNTVNIEMEENNTPVSNNTKEIVDARSFSNKSNKDSLNMNKHSYKNYESNYNNSNSSQIENNSVRSLTSINYNSNNNKNFIRSNTSTNNYRDKSESDIKNSISSYYNSEYTENSLNGKSSSGLNSIRTENEIKENYDEEPDSYFSSNKIKEKHKSYAKSCHSIITIKENNSNTSSRKGTIKLFKHNKKIRNYDNEVESNPVSKLNTQYKNQKKTHVTFEDQEYNENKKIIRLIGTSETEKEIQPYTPNKSKKSKSSLCLNIDVAKMGSENIQQISPYPQNDQGKKSYLPNNLFSIEENESITPRCDFSINKYGFNYFDLDKYTIENQVGEGAYGKIYKIHDEQDNNYALKKNIIHDNNDIPTIMKEYIIMNKLKHPFILDLKGVTMQKLDITTTSIYVLMDLAENDWGIEIKSRYQENPKKFYTEDELILILKQLTAALSYMQKMNVAHRDLKPHNILIFKNFIHKIADFGETQFLNENIFGIGKNNNTNERKGIRGTELFMSPILYQSHKEFKNDNEVIHNPYKSDCYSLGLCILYAASLSLDLLYDLKKNQVNSSADIGEVIEKEYDNIIVKEILNKQFGGRFSNYFENLLLMMLNTNEKERPDFIELEGILQRF